MEPEKYKEAIVEIQTNNGILADDLFKLMDRLALGNPRLLKKERKFISEFIHSLIEQLALNTRVATSLTDLTLSMHEASLRDDKLHELQSEQRTLLLHTFEIIRHFIKENRIDEAIDIIDETLKNMKR